MSAMDEISPSPAKRALIHRFLVANGSQAKIDSGTFLDHLAFPGGPLTGLLPEQVSLQEFFTGPMGALKQAYESHRDIWQEEYESHVDAMFGEEELLQVVDFLESPSGRLYLDASWRMDAYIETNTEAVVEHIVAEARKSLKGGG
jgi:hypothetical protein